MESSDIISPALEANNIKIGQKLAPYNPTNIDCCKIAIELLNISSTDIVYDLGCGDGRFLVEAKKLCPEIQIVGVEYDSDLCAQATRNIQECGFADETWSIIHDNVLNVSLARATVIFVYLVPEGIRAIREALIEVLLRDGRIVTYVFSIPQLNPAQVMLYKGSTKLYLYTRMSLPDQSSPAVTGSAV